MKKKRTNNKSITKYFLKKNLFLFLLFFSCIFLCIGYATVDDLNININGVGNAEIQPGLFITNINVSSTDNESFGNSNNYYQTMMNANVSLSHNIDSEVTFEITLYNNSTTTYVYDKASPSEYDEDYFNNKYIIYKINDGLKNGDKISTEEYFTFSITFKYIDTIDFNNLPSDFSNIINTYINFNFIQLQHIELRNNIMNYDDATANSYINTDGSIIEYNGWTSSTYIDISNYKYFFVYSNGSSLDNWNALYDENFNYIRNVSITNSQVQNSQLGKFSLGISLLKIEDNAKYLRVSSTNSVFGTIKIYPILNDDFNGTLDYNLTEFQLNIDDQTNLYNVNNNVLNTYISNSNGNEITYSGWQASEYIDVNNYNKILISNTSSPVGSGWNAFYDSEKKFVKNFSLSSAASYDSKHNYYVYLTIPENVHYIRLSNSNAAMKNINIFPIKDFEYDKNIPSNLVVGNNLYNKQIINNMYINKDGSEISYSGWSATDYIELDDDKYYFIVLENGSLSEWNAAYDENHNFIESFTCNNTSIYNKFLGNQPASFCIFIKKDNVKYIRLSEKTATASNISAIYSINEEEYNGVLTLEFLNK